MKFGILLGLTGLMNLCNHSVEKLHEATQKIVMADYVWETTSKKSCIVNMGHQAFALIVFVYVCLYSIFVVCLLTFFFLCVFVDTKTSMFTCVCIYLSASLFVSLLRRGPECLCMVLLIYLVSFCVCLLR